ncbi:MBOAT family O-acyltransferase [Desulfosarcina ovata]|uniref:Alginate O-acetyltransferase n=1 Tax=Desulfosarcina ovata subsp. ovata TaxID=2752305 RepID=A0A5K8A5G1_9BACT|nr:MBOAT family protein [Desulfosarcina ovata]BBO87696.1 alginate O-acetyltransferase [Desulfosarcina ovata subsp. ovata]
MVFSSLFFLFAFLPAVILAYYGRALLLQKQLRNLTLLIFSYLFYLFGAPDFILFLAGSTLFDYAMGRLMARFTGHKRLWLTLSLGINLGLLAWFKYANFMVAQTAATMTRLGLDLSGWEAVVLPVGISFFTFQKLSYTIDVYRGRCRPIANVIDFAMYVALFPQLVAGPIVRFRDIHDQIRNRVESWDKCHAGTMRFAWGLCKKVILADTCGRFADLIFSLPAADLDTMVAWLGALAYTLQIYLDFSAYSDMAIGLGLLFGFRFLENFNRPYSAVSLTDFWRRWHISLSRWFRDYLYIPLGGNRKGHFRTAFNLTLVFLLCGFWHGANWTFVVWGAYHGFFLVAERITGLRRIPDERLRALRRVFTLTVVICGWVIFRCDTLSQSGHFFTAMFTFSANPLPPALLDILTLENTLCLILSATALILPAGSMDTENQMEKRHVLAGAAAVVLFMIILPWCITVMAAGSQNPFIYYRF